MTSRAVLITGCSSGIGRATALRLVQAGWRVYATARRVGAIADLRAAGCETLALDVADGASMAAAVAAIEAAEGAVGVLINNAGYSQSGAIEAVPVEQVRKQFETNVFGLVRLTQMVLPGMRRQDWGRVVNVGSMGGKLTFPGGGYYHATKHALEAISDALRFEVKGFGVDVVLIQPGLIRTGFSEVATGSIDTAPDLAPVYGSFHRTVAQTLVNAYQKGPLGRLAGTPDDVAKVILRAISVPRPKARYPVTASARVLLLLRALLPDSAWDAVLAGTYPRPRA